MKKTFVRFLCHDLKMAQFSVNSNLWNCLCILILFSILITLLSVDSPKDFSKNHKLHPKVLFRQLKYMRENISTTQSTPTSINNKVRSKDGKKIPLIYAITPTYYRITQMAELTRLSNTLRQVKRLHWIVIEDWKFTNHYIHDLLIDANMSFTYLAQRTRSSTSYLSKGTDQRNAALHWITHNHYWEDEAVVYFADDDNTYDLRIFEEMRYTKKLSMWPVGLSGNRKFERPIVRNGKVKRFSSWWTEGRVFPMDMAGFAINVNVLWDYHPMVFDTNPRWCCMLETSFLELCCTVEDIEPLADNCTKIYVWHTKTSKPNVTNHVASYGEPYV